MAGRTCVLLNSFQKSPGFGFLEGDKMIKKALFQLAHPQSHFPEHGQQPSEPLLCDSSAFIPVDNEFGRRLISVN